MFFSKIFSNNKSAPSPRGEKLFFDAPERAKARQIVIKDMKNIDGEGIGPRNNQHVHFIVVGTDPLMLNIVRQVTLISHFPNFNDETGANTTKITIISTAESTTENFDALKSALDAAMGNLLDHTKWSMVDASGRSVIRTNSGKLYVDLVLEIIALGEADLKKVLLSKVNGDLNSIVSVVGCEDLLTRDIASAIREKCHQTHVLRTPIEYYEADSYANPRVAQRINMARQLCRSVVEANPDPFIDLNKVKEEGMELSRQLSAVSAETLAEEWGKLDAEQKLACLDCADALPYKMRSLALAAHEMKMDKTLAMSKTLVPMARAEHARWNVEQLLNGFCALNPDQAYKYENLYPKDLAEYKQKLLAARVMREIGSYSKLNKVSSLTAKQELTFMIILPLLAKK